MPDPQRAVLSIGEILIDLIAAGNATSLEDVDTLAVRPGGAPANAAVALARLGVPSAFCGVVGEDPFGRRLLTTLDAEAVDRSRVSQATERDTTLAFAWKDDRGDGHFRILRLADALLGPVEVEQAGIPEMAAIVVGSVSLSAEPARSAIGRAAEIAHEAGVPVCFDANIRPSLWPDLATAVEACRPVMERSMLIKVSLDDARALMPGVESADDAIRELSVFAARFAVVTDGARGAWFGIRVREALVPGGFVPAFRVEAIDPTGAGDAFTAAVVSRLLHTGWSTLTEADIRFAAAAGALATTRHGAMSSLPTRDDVEAFLAQAE
jgi:fructokinase